MSRRPDPTRTTACRGCGTRLPRTSEFFPFARRDDRLGTTCLACARAYAAAHPPPDPRASAGYRLAREFAVDLLAHLGSARFADVDRLAHLEGLDLGSRVLRLAVRDLVAEGRLTRRGRRYLSKTPPLEE